MGWLASKLIAHRASMCVTSVRYFLDEADLNRRARMFASAQLWRLDMLNSAPTVAALVDDPDFYDRASIESAFHVIEEVRMRLWSELKDTQELARTSGFPMPELLKDKVYYGIRSTELWASVLALKLVSKRDREIIGIWRSLAFSESDLRYAMYTLRDGDNVLERMVGARPTYPDGPTEEWLDVCRYRPTAVERRLLR